jgi:hypothetical protein
MEIPLPDDPNVEEVHGANSRAINSIHILYLALNDVIAFEQLVLASGGKNVRHAQVLPFE